MAELTSAVTAVSAAESAIPELTAGGPNHDDQNAATNSKWGQNRDNPAIAGRQGSVPKKQKN